MNDRVAILTRTKSECISLLSDLKHSGVRKCEVFYSWKEIWMAEQKNEYDYILIDYCFFDMFRNDIVCYHLFHKYKYKITFYSNISQNIKTQKGEMAIDLYRMFFRPFVDFNELTKTNSNVSMELETPVEYVDLERKNERKNNKCDFFLKAGYSLIKFHLNEILCLESERNYITIYLDSGKHLIRQTLQSTLDILPKNFYRINRSVIINIEKIEKIVGNRVYIVGLNTFRPVISNKYRREILNAVPLFNEAI